MSLCDIIRVKRSASCGQFKYSSSVHILRSQSMYYLNCTYWEVERGSILKDGAVVTSVAQKGLYLYLMTHSIALSLFNWIRFKFAINLNLSTGSSNCNMDWSSCHNSGWLWFGSIKVSWSQNDFLVSSIFQKTNAKVWWISALEFKKWLNQTIKGPFSC